MDSRFIIGLAALATATSCVAPGAGRYDVAQRAVARAHTQAKPAPIVPAGPSPMMLSAPPVATPADAVVPAEAPPFIAPAQTDDAARALDCLTAAVYYEARSEPIEGQEAVAQVVLNRVRNPAFPNSVCGTVYEGSSRDTGCQFTFTCDGSLLARREPAAWERARRVAAAALGGFVYTPVGNATFYHTTAILPWWAPSLNRVTTIGAHIFYRLKGAWGGALAFNQRYAGIEPATAVGARYPEKAAAQIVEDIEAGVTIHRGDRIAEGAAEASFGVRIHRSGDAATPVRSAMGVTIHRSAPTSDIAESDA